MKAQVAAKSTTTKIPPPKATAATMVLKSQVQAIHIWCHHSGTYYKQTLICQQIHIMADRLTSYEAFELKINQVR